MPHGKPFSRFFRSAKWCRFPRWTLSLAVEESTASPSNNPNQRTEGTAHFNIVAVVDADGAALGHYRKSHIPGGSD